MQDEALPLSQGQIWVIEEGELLFQTTHTEGQVARRQDEENNTDDRGGQTHTLDQILHFRIMMTLKKTQTRIFLTLIYGGSCCNVFG